MRPSALALLILLMLAAAAVAEERTFRRIEVVSAETALQIGYAERALGLNDLDAAQLHARNALRRQPKTAEAQLMMGIVAGRRQEHGLAESSFTKAVTLNPDYYPAWHYRAMWHCERGQWEPAFADFERGLRAPQRADRLTGHVEATRCALRAGRRERAWDFLRAGLDAMPDAVPLLSIASRMALEDGDVLRARAFLQRMEALRDLDAAALQLAIDIERTAGDGRAQKRYEARLQSLRESQPP